MKNPFKRARPEEPVQQTAEVAVAEWLDDPDHEFDVEVDSEAAQEALDTLAKARRQQDYTEPSEKVYDVEGEAWSVRWSTKNGLLYLSGHDGVTQAQFSESAAFSLVHYIMELPEADTSLK